MHNMVQWTSTVIDPLFVDRSDLKIDFIAIYTTSVSST